MVELIRKDLELKQRLFDIKRNLDENCKQYFCDVQIDCQSIILPAHKYVLSSRSEVFAKQLASGVNELSKSTTRHIIPEDSLVTHSYTSFLF